VIQGNLVVSEKTRCVIQATGGSTFEARSIGVLDLLLGRRYYLFPVVTNNLPLEGAISGAKPANLTLEGNSVTLRGAWISYKLDGLKGHYGSGAATQLPKQFAPTMVTLAPGVVNGAQIEVVTPQIAMALDNDAAFNKLGSGGYMMLGIYLEGTTANGDVVRSEEFSFPIFVCRGCLASYDVVPEDCCQFLKAPDKFPCYPGQDERYSCLLGCWLNLLERPERFAEKAAMVSGYIQDLSTDLGKTTLPEWFSKKIAPSN